jgi:hypothetical protein
VTYSRGYRRKNLIIDGDFESYQCPDNSNFCYTESEANWITTSPSGGYLDAAIFHCQWYAFQGTGVAILGANAGGNTLPGTMSVAKPLNTQVGVEYTLEVYHWSAWTYSGGAGVDILWNGEKIGSIPAVYESTWTPHQFTMKALGNDILSFVGGSGTNYDFLDNISLF